ncbi:WS/DGAT/MGAT family O-acyltransferase [Nocardioides campestrisoli]|uniref:WS/DGAT/MGAT family O-acyltransferase n=1 Tax=Nocardioides campestrisoli TaxID=2736757 RepID=UPI00163DA1F8|nr:wax ester/triacylglycerol synthase family O-acyltransferase [Nocardioides campestrisoli]
MRDRLRSRDLAFLATDSPATPMHNATLEIFEPGPRGFEYSHVLELIAERISYVPRYRQRLQAVPGRLANPVWVDDEEFDLSYHVRRSALPRPGNEDQLRELTARIVSRSLDRTRPLWEVYVIEGLAEGRVAILAKSHQILVDGVETVDLGQVMLDVNPDQEPLGLDEWRPARAPTPASLIASAVRESLERPSTLVSTARGNVGALLRTADAARTRATHVAGALANRRPAPDTPVTGSLSQQRRVVTIATDLADYRQVRRVHGTSVNDVVLATVTGALRAWLMTRDEALHGIKRLKAVVPMSVIDDELEATSMGTQVTGHEVYLPVGEPSAVVRLLQVSYGFHNHRETGRAVAAQRLAGIAGFAPTTFHALGSRVAAAELRRGFHLSVTNVPGPQFPLYAAGARMLESYPVHPLQPGHALAIGVTSYDGKVFYGLTVDRDLVPDADVLGQCVVEALEELKDSASDSRPRAPRGRRRTGSPTRRDRKEGSRPAGTPPASPREEST